MEDEDDDDDDEKEMPEEAGETYAIQIHTDGEMPQGENTENNHRRSNRNTNRPNRYGSISYKENFWV